MLPLAALVLAACAAGPPSGDGSGPTDDPSVPAGAPLSVSAALDRDDGPTRVSGFVVADEQRVRLCELLLESFPPQCGGATLDLDLPDSVAVGLDEEGGVRWTANPVVVTGSLDGDLLRVTAVALGPGTPGTP